MTDDPIFVSVIIPVFNCEPWLEDCLDSVLRQDHENLEIICINDGSTDSGPAILRTYSKKDKRIIFRSQKNHGLGYTRNKGIRIASGKYLMFLDSDDMLAEGIISKLVRRAESDALDLLAFDKKTLYEPADLEALFPWEKRHHQFDYPGVYDGRTLFSKMWALGDYYPEAWKNLYLNEWIRNTRLSFPEKILHEDMLWSYRCYTRAERCGFSAEQGYIRRVREDSIITKGWSIDDLHAYVYTANEMEKICSNDKALLNGYSGFLQYARNRKNLAAKKYQQAPELFRSQIRNDHDQKLLNVLDSINDPLFPE